MRIVLAHRRGASRGDPEGGAGMAPSTSGSAAPRRPVSDARRLRPGAQGAPGWSAVRRAQPDRDPVRAAPRKRVLSRLAGATLKYAPHGAPPTPSPGWAEEDEKRGESGPRKGKVLGVMTG